jgi:hypothetical protein
MGQETRPAEQGTVASVSATPVIPKPLPFKPGETLIYEAKLSKAILSGTVGELKLSVREPAQPEMENVLELRAEATSKGFFPALVGLKIRDVFTTTVSVTDLGLVSSTREIHETKTRRFYKSTINREKGLVTFTEIDRTKPKAEPRTRQKPCPTWVQDVLSAIYFVRTRELKEKDVIPVPLSDLGENYNIEVIVGGREDVKTRAGRFRAVRLDAKIFDGRFSRRSGELLVWMSDDERRLPVLAKLKTSGYTATVELKRIGDARPPGS